MFGCRKTSLNDLLVDATRDALDLVKSLLVLDPLGRLTAKQALDHPYVEKYVLVPAYICNL